MLYVHPVLQAYTLAALRGELGVTGADNPQRHQLTREMLRYIRGETGGRAVLVSGHRGVGKTSLVLNAVQRAREALAGKGLRPLLVRLDAPSLFMPDGSAADQGERGDVELVLRRVAIALFQTMEQEIWRELLDRARRGALPDGVSAEELTELTTRLRSELSQAPTLADLRELWQRAGLLGGAGLFGAPGDVGHGLREVLAIWAAVRAHHVASDTVVDSAEQDRAQEQTEERARQSTWALRELLNPVVALMAGGLAGAGLLSGGDDGVWAAVAGTITTLLTGVTLDVTVKHFRQNRRSFTYKVTKDTTPYALTRLLPQLVTQLRETGLAPIFVVDELDKVKEQRHRLDSLVGRLKSFVAEDAFFCFLTDRDYYELLAALAADHAWPASAAAFSDRLFVCYRPADLRGFLRELLQGAPKDAPPVDLDERTIQVRDLVISGLLGRTRGHLQDLHRALRAMTRSDNSLELPEDGPAAHPSWVTPAIYQSAVEHALALPALQDRALTDAYLLQLAFDAIALPVRSWEQGDSELTLSPEALRAWMEQRMDLTELAEAGHPIPRAPLTAPDLALLYEVVLRLCDALADPGPPAGCEACVLPLWRPALEALGADGRSRTYRWTCDPWGRDQSAP